jgi:oxygen-dependent protoporphyrinogen oxidase
LRLGRKAISTKVFSPDGFGARPQETIATWGERCLGKASVDYLLAPALGGIYAAPPSELSAGLILASLKEARKNAVGLKQKGSVAPQGGMGEFSEKLAHWLAKEGVLFRYMERVAAVVAEPGQKTVIATSLADSIELLHDSFPQASARLGALKRIPILSATVFLRKEEMAFAGFGCLFPRDQGFRALGVLSNTHIFPGRVTEHSETWIFRDEPGDSIVAGNDDAGLLDLIRRDRRKLANREAEFLDAKVSRWPNGIPCYDLALEEFLSSGVLDGLAKNGIFLHGNYLGRLGLSGIVDRSATFPRLIGA